MFILALLSSLPALTMPISAPFSPQQKSWLRQCLPAT